MNTRNTKDVFIPANEKQRTLILRIQREVADSPFMEVYKMTFVPETYKIYTTVLMFMEGVKRVLFKNEKQTISIGDLIVIQKSTRFRETAEKSGNINCFLKLGPIGESILNNGIDGFKDVLMDDPVMKADMQYAQSIASKELDAYGIGYNIQDFELYQVVMIFLIHMILVIKEYAENPNVDEHSFRLEIGGYFTAYFKRTDDSYDIIFNSGATLKKSVKSDGYTER